MIQMNLISPIDIAQKRVSLENVRATFTENGNGGYDVVLEINSNKFLIAMENVADHIERLEIIATKGFIEISNKFILMIRRLIEHLRYRID